MYKNSDRASQTPSYAMRETVRLHLLTLLPLKDPQNRITNDPGGTLLLTI